MRRGYAAGVQAATRSRIDGHWSRRFGVPVPGLQPVTVAGSGRYDDAALVVLLGDHAYVDTPLAALDAVTPLALTHGPAELLDPATWAPVATGPVPGPADHFWADHGTDLSVDAPTIDPADLELLRPAVSEELEAFLVQKHQRYCVCKPVPNASAIGTAAASLLRD